MREYRCQRCHHLLFKGSLKLLLTRQHDPSKQTVEPKCDKCGLINRFSLDDQPSVIK